MVSRATNLSSGPAWSVELVPTALAVLFFDTHASKVVCCEQQMGLPTCVSGELAVCNMQTPGPFGSVREKYLFSNGSSYRYVTVNTTPPPTLVIKNVTVRPKRHFFQRYSVFVYAPTCGRGCMFSMYNVSYGAGVRAEIRF
jgi:hypothetical protein